MRGRLLLLAVLLLFTFPAFCQNALTDSLIAYYPFNGDAKDASGNGNDGTVYGAALTNDRFGNSNSAYLFNSANNTYIKYIQGPKFTPTIYPVSVTAWIKANCSTTGSIFDNDNTPSSTSNSGFSVQVNSPYVANSLLGSICDGQGLGPGTRSSILGQESVNDNTWHFVAVVFRGLTDMDIYIDCNYDHSAYYDGTGTGLQYLFQGGSTGTNFDGVIDDIRFYHRNLSSSDLQTIFAYPYPYPVLSVELPDEITACNGDQLTIAPITIGNIQSYMWSTGSDAFSIQPTKSGSYILQVFDGCNYASDTTNVTFENCDGVEQVNANSPFNMSYSPESNSVQIQNIMPGQDNFTIDLYNTLGQKVVPTVSVKNNYQTTYSYSLPQNLLPGIYFVSTRVGNRHQTLPVAGYFK